ncbi:MAG: class I SAM-dependent methyltransferase [Synechococcus sp.]
MTWSHGYFAESGYTYGFYPEQSPEIISLAALINGHRPPDLNAPFRYLDLGCGQGFHLCLLAACYPHASFTGIDLNPEHIAHGRHLAARAGLQNIQFLRGDFVRLAQDPPRDWPPFDLACAHGVATWVSPEVREAMVSLASQLVREGGLFYVSYNTMPGWLGMVPFQHAVNSFQSRESAGAESLRAATAFFGSLKEASASLFQYQPDLAARLALLPRQDGSYLLQEYNHQCWQPAFVDSMINDLASGGFNYLGSATLPENFDGLLPPAQRDLVTAQADRALAELCRDLLVNKGFRRDVYAKGRDPIWRREMELTIDRIQVISLVSVNQVTDEAFEFKTTMGEIKGRPEHFRAMLKEMEMGPISIGELRQRLDPGHVVESAGEDPTRTSQAHLLQNLALCLQARLVGLVPVHNPDPGPAQRFNQVITETTSAGAPYQAVALPLAGNGLMLGDLELLVLEGSRHYQPDQLSDHLARTLKILGRSLSQEGQRLEGETLKARLQELVIQVQERRLPLLRRLGAWA